MTRRASPGSDLINTATSNLDEAGNAILWFDKVTVERLWTHAKNSPESMGIGPVSDPIPALWLVGDGGIYLMSNGKPYLLAEIEPEETDPEVPRRSLTALALGCDPRHDHIDNWWPIHNTIDEGNDFAFEIGLQEFEPALHTSGTHIVVVVRADEVSVFGDSYYRLLNRITDLPAR